MGNTQDGGRLAGAMRTARQRAAARPTVRRGRKPVHTEPHSKVTVVLADRQIVDLATMSLAVRKACGKPLSRAEIIRAVVDAALASGLPLATATSEAELREMVAGALAAR